MPSAEVRFVWLFVFFDLPVGTKTERRATTRFRNFLKDDGFMMLQYSVYARVCRGEDGAMKHVARVTRNLPGKGSVRALQVTDRQYARMRLLLGEATKTESGRRPTDGTAVNSASARSRNSLRFQTSIRDRAYHGEIGREATASRNTSDGISTAYHGEIGREATANPIFMARGAAESVLSLVPGRPSP